MVANWLNRDTFSIKIENNNNEETYSFGLVDFALAKTVFR